MQEILSMRKFFRMSELWKMGTMRWTITHGSGFEGLQPVRLTGFLTAVTVVNCKALVKLARSR